MKCRLLLSLSLLAAILFAACHSYEEGPQFTLKNQEKLLTSVDYWTVKEVVKNQQQEITDQYKLDYIDFGVESDFRAYDNSYVISQPPFTRDTTLERIGRGTWRCLKEKNRLEMIYSFQAQDRYNDSIFYTEERYEQWTILRLTETELWLENDSIRIKYTPQL